MRQCVLYVAVVIVAQFAGCVHMHGSGLSHTYRDHAFVSVWGTGPNNVFVGGTKGLVLHFDGQSWTEAKLGTGEDRSGTFSEFSDTIAVVAGTSKNNVFATTYSGGLYHFDGQHWYLLHGKPVYGVIASAVSQGDSIFFGSDIGDFITYDNTTWNLSISALDPNGFNSLIFDGERMLAGREKEGVHLFRDGGWESLTPTETAVVRDVWSTGTRIYAAMDSGLMYLEDEELVPVASDISATYLRALWGFGDVVYAVGAFGTLAMYDGKIMTIIPIPTANHLSDIWGAGANNIYITGSDGTILHFNGHEWKHVFR